MKTNKCRVCGSNFFEKPLLKYRNMPSVAQNFPDKENLDKDKGLDLEVFQCSGCGLVQLNNEPVAYFKEVIRAASVSPEMKEFRIKQFNEFIEKYHLNDKRIIEVGCGRGEYLSIMQEAGADVYGLEEKEESVKECVKNNLKVSKGFVENDFKIEGCPFDAFFILNFLEHIPNINSTLRGIFNNLIDNAMGIIEVPNFDMILREKLFSEFMRDHLFYFTKETLKITLELNGFEVMECKEVWHDYIISAIVKKRKRLELQDFYKHQEKIKIEIDQFINKFKNKKVAIWGAGHQALAVISLLDLDDRIVYVVDSAKFKQGKYTPASHIPVVSPEALESDPLEAIIVMAAAYSDEVAGIIKQKYGNKIDIAILRDFGLEVI